MVGIVELIISPTPPVSTPRSTRTSWAQHQRIQPTVSSLVVQFNHHLFKQTESIVYCARELNELTLPLPVEPNRMKLLAARFQATEPSDAQLRSAESATQAARQRAALAGPTANGGFQFAERIPAASSASPAKALSSPRSKTQAQAPRPIAQARQEAESIEQVAIAQLQEPIEQIRQTELNSRARKSRHAPFYLFTV